MSTRLTLSTAASPARGRNFPSRRVASLALAAAVAFAASGCGSSAGSPGDSPTASGQNATRTVTDMAGRQVELPVNVTRVVTLGSVPVINSFLFALGKGDLIVDGLPPNFTKDTRWKYQYVFGPQIGGQPVMQSPEYGAKAEEIVAAKPDVVLTMTPGDVDQLDKIGVKTIVLRWQNDEDVKKVVTLLGEALNVPDRAQDYSQTFDAIVAEVGDAVKDVPDAQRVSALSLDPKSMGQPHTIAQWWIARAGGKPVTEGNTNESLKFSAEQVVAWNPQVIFVNDPTSVKTSSMKRQLRARRGREGQAGLSHADRRAHLGQPHQRAAAVGGVRGLEDVSGRSTQDHLKRLTHRFYKGAYRPRADRRAGGRDPRRDVTPGSGRSGCSEQSGYTVTHGRRPRLLPRNLAKNRSQGPRCSGGGSSSGPIARSTKVRSCQAPPL